MGGRVVDEAGAATQDATAANDEGGAKALRRRIEWWWTGIVEWLLDLPFAVRERVRGPVGRVMHGWWRLTDAGLDLLHSRRARPGYTATPLGEVEAHADWHELAFERREQVFDRRVSVLHAEAEDLRDLPRAAGA